MVMNRGRIPDDDLHESLSEGEGACSGICDGRCVSRKAGVFSGSQTHRGKSQEPRSLDSREEGNQISETY